MLKATLHFFVFVILTVLTQIGGLAWLLAFVFQRRFIAFVACYAFMSLGTLWIAPIFGRVPLSCSKDGSLQVQSVFYCALNRQYVVPEIKQMLEELAEETDRAYPGTVVQVLDANFPFVTGFPLLPHLSHDDGNKVDLAFLYQSNGVYLPGRTKSPIGYFAFEEGPSDCPSRRLTLRWDFRWLQGLWPDYDVDLDRTGFVLSVLIDDPRVGKVFLEPHLKQRFGLVSDKIRFQGCRAARHDDHIHLQL